MMDTNNFQHAIDTAVTFKAQISPYLPALAVASGWAGREIANFNRWLKNVIEWMIGHGGIGWLIWKLIWNPPAK